MNTEEYNDLINSLIHNRDPLIALCSSDVEYIRERYELCEIKLFHATDNIELFSHLNELGGLPYETYIVVFHIPREALEEIFYRKQCCEKSKQCVEKLIFFGAIETQNLFEATVGCYKQSHAPKIRKESSFQFSKFLRILKHLQK